ncbi:MAG: response regulator transcription factor [Chloroflexota bacterium]|nr:response regulator transcription factor [Chloroflexota bacterium]
MTTIRVLLAEDQTLMRHGLRTILELEDGFEVVGEAADGPAAIAQALALRPDVVLMDVQLPEIDGIAATERIAAAAPQTRVVILTTFEREDYVIAGIKAGAHGHLLKEVPAEELLETIRRVHAGESVIQPRLASRLLGEFARRGSAGAPTPDALTERELDVLRLVAAGQGNKEIARALGLVEGTVKNYVSTILDKLRAANRTQAALVARDAGLI